MRTEDSKAWIKITSLLGDPWPPKAPKILSDRVRSLAVRGLGNPHNLSQAEVQELSRSVMDHINIARQH